MGGKIVFWISLLYVARSDQIKVDDTVLTDHRYQKYMHLKIRGIITEYTYFVKIKGWRR